MHFGVHSVADRPRLLEVGGEVVGRSRSSVEPPEFEADVLECGHGEGQALASVRVGSAIHRLTGASSLQRAFPELVGFEFEPVDNVRHVSEPIWRSNV